MCRVSHLQELLSSNVHTHTTRCGENVPLDIRVTGTAHFC